MEFDWARWDEKKECAELHGVTPGFAEAIASQGENRFEDAFLNVRPDPIDLRDRYYEPALLPIPTRVAPPDLDLLGLSVRDQGAEGSCTGQALAAVIDLQNFVRRSTLADEDRALPIPNQVSARMLYEMARLHDEYVDDGLPGSSVRGALRGFFHNGACNAALAPYFAGDLDWTLSVEMGKDARCTSLGAYYRLRHVLNDYHSALGEVGALLCSAMVHKGWLKENVRAAGGRILFPDDGAVELDGAHAFAIVGFDHQGFYVLNSWGRDWGGSEDLEEGELRVRRAGIAHWSYKDWQAHVLDSWAVRLAAPFPGAFGMIGGFVRPSAIRSHDGLLALEPQRPMVSRQEILGHYLHLNDGRLVTRGSYPSSLASVRETAAYLRNMDDEPDPARRYDRVLFYAHGGLNTLGDATARMAAMTKGFKRNGVYPIFILWRTGLLETLGDVLRGVVDRVLLRTGGAEDFTNRLIEEAAQRVGRPIWNDMKEDGARAYTGSPGEGWLATDLLLDALAERQVNPVTVHFIGHSAGAILLGRLFERMNGQANLPEFGSVSLMAPACTGEFFARHLDPFAAGNGGARRCTALMLSDAAERADQVARLYRRSLLYLISNGLEGTRRVPIAGMERFWPGSSHWRAIVAAPGSEDSRSSTHGGFDNDAVTMNSVLSSICGRRLTETNGGFTAAELARSP